MTHAYSDVLLVGGRPNQWVKYVNNDGNAAHVYVSTAVTTFQSATTGAGVYTFNPSPIGGIYTSYLIDGSLSATAPAAGDVRWAPSGITSHVVSYTVGDDAALNSTTVSGSPYTNTLPGDATTTTPAGVETGALWDYGGEVWNLNAFGAKFDSRAVSDAAITTGTAILTSATAAFTAADVGKLVGVAGAGAAAVALKTTILSFQSATQVTLAVNAGTTVSGASARFATDDGPAIVRALTKMGTTGHILACPSPRYSVGTQVPVSIMRLTVRGTGRTGGCIIDWYGTGSLFELGTDNGQAYDGNYYDGIETFSLEDITIQDPFPTTALTNGQGSYTPGTMVVRDWRGGDQVWKNVTISNFDYPFWGIQSDLNRWDHVKVQLCHSGVYVGPRSDQWLFEDCYFVYNDRVADIDRAQHPKFHSCYFVDNGAVGTNPIKIHTAWTFGQWAASFDDCWFEQYLGVAAALEAFIEIGVGDTVQSSQLHIRNPSILTNASGGGPHMQYLVKVGRATHIVIEEPTAQIFGSGAPGTAASIEALVSCVAATSPDILIRLPKTYTAGGSFFATVVTSGGATPNTTIEAWGSQGWQIFSGQLTVTGGQALLGNDTLAVDSQFAIDTAAAHNRQISFQTAGSPRWIMRVTNTAEGGADAGSDLSLLPRTDAGGAKTTVFTIFRSNGLTVWGDGYDFQFGTTTGTKLGTGATQKLGFYGATPVTQRSGAAQAAVAATGSTNTAPFGYTTAAQADAIVTLLNELRAWAVAQGFIKGSA